jgi:hypothetical protein
MPQERTLYPSCWGAPSAPPRGDNFPTRRRAVLPSRGAYSAAPSDRPASAVFSGAGEAGRAARSHAGADAAAAPPPHRPGQRCGVQAVGAAAHDEGAAPQASRAGARSTALRPGTPRPRGGPAADRGRRPPPSTSCLCPAWLCRRSPPCLRRGKTALSHSGGPVEGALGLELAPQRAPGCAPHVLCFPSPQTSPARPGGGGVFGPGFPPGAGP